MGNMFFGANSIFTVPERTSLVLFGAMDVMVCSGETKSNQILESIFEKSPPIHFPWIFKADLF